MTEYERKFIVNPFLKENCETESKRWYNLFDKPFELLQRFNYELHYLLGWIKNLEKDQSTKDALEDHLIIAIYTFSDIDFLKKIANLLISCGKAIRQRLLTIFVGCKRKLVMLFHTTESISQSYNSTRMS